MNIATLALFRFKKIVAHVFSDEQTNDNRETPSAMDEVAPPERRRVFKSKTAYCRTQAEHDLYQRELSEQGRMLERGHCKFYDHGR